MTDVIHVFAKVESEIASFGVAPPTPWPWAINADGTTNVALRLHQMIEFRDKLKRATPQEIAEMGRRTAAQWRARNEERRKLNRRARA